MKTPFKENPEMDIPSVLKARAAIRRFRDQCVENFNKFKEAAFKCVNVMQIFISDTQTTKLVKSFVSSVEDLETKVNGFIDLFDDLKDKEFSKNVVEAIEKIQSQCDDLNEIIDERIKPHIQSNILAKNWVDSVSNDLQIEVQKRTPLILDLFNKRQDSLNDALKEKTSK